MATLLMEVSEDGTETGQYVVTTAEGADTGETTVFEGLEHFADASEAVPEQDLVSLAMETSKVLPEKDQSSFVDVQEAVHAPVAEEEYPDEIECQLIQKSVYIGGQMQMIDFIMCNQCPRLFRTENLLWNHIKAKHKRRSYNRPAPARTLPLDDDEEAQELPNHSVAEGELEPGEIDPPAHAVKPVAKTPNKNQVFIVGLDKSAGKKVPRQEHKASPSPAEPRSNAKNRMYVDSNIGPFKCPGCDNVSFTNRRNLELHLKRLHKAGISDCDECGRKVLDLKRHKEILHKRFKIFDCPHCNDKFCSQEDMERHLAKVEKNNRVEGINKITKKQVTVNKVKDSPKVTVSEETTTEDETETEAEAEEAAEATKENQSTADVVKKLEEKIFRCSDCGMKTPSRMTYIQHVLNGCIMDMVQEQKRDGDVKVNYDGTVSVTPRPKRGRPKGSLNKSKRPKLEEDEENVEG